MKIKVTDFVLSYENKPLIDQDKNPLTWRSVILESLNAQPDNNEKFTPEEKVKCFHLTAKAFEKEEVQYNLEDAAFILSRIKKVCFPIICGRAEQIFK